MVKNGQYGEKRWKTVKNGKKNGEKKIVNKVKNGQKRLTTVKNSQYGQNWFLKKVKNSQQR